MTVTIHHAKTNNITDWTQAQLDAIIAGDAPPLPPGGTVLNDVVLPSDWNNPLITSMSTGKLLGRATADDGPFEEISLTTTGTSGAATLSGGNLNIPQYAGTVTSVGVSGANGIDVSGSPITSSGTIALSLGDITPTSVATTGSVTSTQNGIATTSTDGLALINSTASTAGVTNQYSPRARFRTAVWNGSSSDTYDWIWEARGGSIVLQSSLNGAAFTSRLTIGAAGDVQPGRNVLISNGSVIGLSQYQIAPSTTGLCTFTSLIGTAANQHLFTGGATNITQSSGSLHENFKHVSTFAPASGSVAFYGTSRNYTINQSGTASGSYVADYLNVTETSLLGAAGYLLRYQLGGSDRFTVTSTGAATFANGVTALSFTGALAASNLTSGTLSSGVGMSATSYSGGTQSSGTYTPATTNGNFQHITNGGAFTLAPPSTVCTIIVEILNNGSAGAITTSGFTKVTGDALTTVNGSKFHAYITKTQNYSSLNIVALQ